MIIERGPQEKCGNFFFFFEVGDLSHNSELQCRLCQLEELGCG